MRVVLTGSSGRVGRAIFNALAGHHEVIGLDRYPFSTTHVVGDVADKAVLRPLLKGADAVIHTAALHAPHVGGVPDVEFQRVNIEGTRALADEAMAADVKRLVLTSTTALYGNAIVPGACTWVDEATVPVPKSIYHRTKLDAEHILEGMARPGFDVRVLRMSRSFPEPGDVMAAYRLHRGIDVRDVAEAHLAALTNSGPHFQRHIISATPVFARQDCEALARDAAPVIRLRAPRLATAFEQRGWTLPLTVDRVYDPGPARHALGWQPRFGFSEVLSQMDRGSLEVLPAGSRIDRKPE
ncbi:MAG: epimerase [Stappia sp.]|uniref:NAD-dependent epimerase/dehydratase family protein n=1 Tax=Stappia sp. TaxID=1870903 RepID=UPI000C3CF3B6|nr:NAD(P)-dependent oxidoreductase [Stappia sp.]MAA97683.1 epimerase [Stappia sp.]MBM20065.1 epimerase [Stappia sp.]MBM20701.1 epimerase [Stappia sp.]